MNAKPGFVFSPLMDIIAKRGAKLGTENYGIMVLNLLDADGVK